MSSGVRIIAAVTLIPTDVAKAGNPRAQQVLSTDFGEGWPLTVNSGALNCVQNGQAIFIGRDGFFGTNGTAKNFAEENDYHDVREISKLHPNYRVSRLTLGRS